MKKQGVPAILIAVVVLLSGALMIPLRARDFGAYESAPALMAQAKAQAIQLKEDAAALESFDRMPVLCEFESIQEHARDAQVLAAKLEGAIAGAYPWQKAAMR